MSAYVRHLTLPNTSRLLGSPRTGGRIPRLGALPILAEKQIALACAGSWHQHGGGHERGTRGWRGQDERIWAAELSCAVLACLGQMQHHPGSPTGLAATKGGLQHTRSERESRTWDGPRGQVLHWVRRRCLKVADSWGSLL